MGNLSNPCSYSLSNHATEPTCPATRTKKMKSESRTFKFAACQVAVGADKDANLASAAAAVAEAASNGAKMVALPECFNCPYGNDYFPDYAEPVDGASAAALSAMARDNGV